MKLMICHAPGCQRTALEGKHYCIVHIKLEDNYGKRYAKRKKSNQWHYLYNSSRWRRTSKEFLQKYPVCFICGSPAQVVDHVQPHRGDIDLFYDEANFEPLCTRCHNAKTLKENNYYRREEVR